MDFEKLTKEEWAKLAEEYFAQYEETMDERLYELNLFATFLSLDVDEEMRKEHLKKFKEVYYESSRKETF